MKIDNGILIVDDDISNLQLLTGLLEKEGYQIRPAENAQIALDAALAKPPALILLDVRMPGMDGFELCKLLKQDKLFQDIPVIFISSLDAADDKVRGFEAGGVDYITKPFHFGEVLARISTHLKLCRLQRHGKDHSAGETDPATQRGGPAHRHDQACAP